MRNSDSHIVKFRVVSYSTHFLITTKKNYLYELIAVLDGQWKVIQFLYIVHF